MHNPFSTSRRTSRPTAARAAFVVAAAILLASVPVLPLRFMGIPGPGSDLTNVSQVGNFLLGRFGSQRKTSPAQIVAEVQKSTTPQAVASVRVLEHTALRLNDQIQKQRTDPALHNRVGVVYMSLGEMNKALEHFQEAVELARTGLSSAGNQVEMLRKQAKLSEACDVIMESSRLNVELSAAHSNLARVYEKLGQHDKVVAELDALNREGAALAAGSQTTQADTDHHISAQAARLLARGESFMSQRLYVEAIQEFKNVIAINPTIALAHHELGLASALTGDVHQAVAELSAAARLEPGDAALHNNLGLALQQTGNVDAAQKEFEKAIALNPKLIDAAMNLGTLNSAQGQYASSRHAFEKAVLANPQSAIAHNHLATALSMEGDYEKAISEFRRTLAIEPNLASAHYGLGLALYNNKNYSPAINEFKRALTLDPSLTGAHEKIEQAHRKAGLAAGGAYGFN